MLLRKKLNALVALHEVEQRDQLLPHELGGNGPAHKRREFSPAQRKVLLDLNDAERIISTLCLNREYVVGARAVYPEVDLIGLDLAKSSDRRPKVILQGVAGHAGEDVYEAVVAEFRQECLLVVQPV